MGFFLMQVIRMKMKTFFHCFLGDVRMSFSENVKVLCAAESCKENRINGIKTSEAKRI